MQKRSQYQKLFKPGTLFYKKKKSNYKVVITGTVSKITGYVDSVTFTAPNLTFMTPNGNIDNINNNCLCKANVVDIRMIIGWSQPTIFGVKTWNIMLLNGSGHIENVGLAYLESCVIIENVEESEN